MAVDTSGDLELARRLQEQEEEEAGITQSVCFCLLLLAR